MVLIFDMLIAEISVLVHQREPHAVIFGTQLFEPNWAEIYKTFLEKYSFSFKFNINKVKPITARYSLFISPGNIRKLTVFRGFKKETPGSNGLKVYNA